jgi:uncharacterized protein (TIGR02145 family)
MAENLKTTIFNDNSLIPYVPDNDCWTALSSPGYCRYENTESNKEIYGTLYNWDIINIGLICPSGWHVPTNDEWKTLEMQLGLSQKEEKLTGGRWTDQGLQLKSESRWYLGRNGNNSSGVTGIPGGTPAGSTSYNGLFVGGNVY